MVGLSKSYNGKAAVKDLSLSVPAGEVFAFLGPNGAGKTTTIKMLVGLLRPSAGTIRICGLDLATDSQEARGKLAYVPDQPYLYEKLSGREFLHFVGGMFGIPRGEVEERIERLTQVFDLGSFLDHLSESYSHGMKQRLVFASALLHDPSVMVLDEPMVGLDPHSARVVLDLFRREAARGTTIFMSTHSLPVAEKTADRIGILKDGELVALGSMAELKARTGQEGDLEEIFLALTGEDAG
ncbi:MAG: ABC transporter ATP-binding protein [Planctomycetes bacterium]|nr:ABC transporter ATP-binding protein [Planctomycetota bacterium]